MTKAILYKEWLKTRWYYLLANAITIGFILYSILRIERVSTLKGVQHIWDMMLQRDVIFVDILQYIPLIVGVMLAVVQFAPEMHNKSLKLTLHLPSSALRMVLTMIMSGAGMLIICFAVNLIILWLYLQSILAPELQAHIMLTLLVWYVAGITAYLLTSWICLEPTWKMRVINLIISSLIIKIFYISPTPESYNSFVPWLALYTVTIIALPWRSVVRFKIGKQD